jgi:hypothetical protein
VNFDLRVMDAPKKRRLVIRYSPQCVSLAFSNASGQTNVSTGLQAFSESVAALHQNHFVIPILKCTFALKEIGDRIIILEIIHALSWLEKRVRLIRLNAIALTKTLIGRDRFDHSADFCKTLHPTNG